MYIEYVKSFIETYPDISALILILAKIVGAVGFFPGTPLTLLSGALFGVWKGTLIALIGNVLGAILAFLLARYFVRDYVTKKIASKYPKIAEYEKRFFKDGFKTVVMLRLIPLFPFNGLNYLLGITRVKIREYSLGTALGIIPGTFVFVYFGESLAMLSFYNIAISICAIIGLIYLGKIYEQQ